MVTLIAEKKINITLEEFFDRDEDILPMPDFINNLKLSIADVFSWLRF